MSYEMNIIQPEDIREKLVIFFRKKNIIPIIGSGFSSGLKTLRGEVPTGEKYLKYMKMTLCGNKVFSEEDKKLISSESFSKICDYYEDDENVSADIRLNYLKENFYKVDLKEDDLRASILNINWPYIYTLNIDDTIERNSDYNTVILPNRELNDEVFNQDKCIIKLHGDIGEIVKYKKYDKIFTSKEYALSINKNASLLNKLGNDYLNQNILFIGCSLTDEMDIKSIGEWPLDFENANELSKKIIFVKDRPSRLQMSQYKLYGITDIVCFEEFNEMYIFLLDVWKESMIIQENELEMYKNITISNITDLEKEKNQDYFLWSKHLYDKKKNKINYPFYFISRGLTGKIIQNLKKNKIHLIYGKNYSGKSYILFDLYRTITDREVFYFDGRSRLSNKALNMLLDKREIIALFDVGALTREQFELLVQNADKICKHKCNYIINLNSNDSDTFGIIKWKMRKGIIQTDDIIDYKVGNRFKDSNNAKELTDINNLLPKINLPQYNSDRTILDQMVYAGDNLNCKHKFFSYHIKIENEKQLAMFIILAIKEKMYASEVFMFSLDKEIYDAIKKYSPFIERVEVDLAEKKNSDLSSIKYVLNSKYWLRQELGIFARVAGNDRIIAGAYKYIIHQVIECSDNNEYKKKRLCRDFVMFDVMNDIFLNKYRGNITLIVKIYSELKQLLANDHNFLHQNAKCFVNYFYYISNKEVKRKYLKEANELAVVSKSIIENRYEQTGNDRLLISLAHVQYTVATIVCEMCAMDNYSDEEMESIALKEVYEAILSPYNSDDYRRDKRQQISKGIAAFIKHIASKGYMHYDSKSQKIINEILNI